jgi:hypothetical protein
MTNKKHRNDRRKNITLPPQSSRGLWRKKQFTSSTVNTYYPCLGFCESYQVKLSLVNALFDRPLYTYCTAPRTDLDHCKVCNPIARSATLVCIQTPVAHSHRELGINHVTLLHASFFCDANCTTTASRVKIATGFLITASTERYRSCSFMKRYPNKLNKQKQFHCLDHTIKSGFSLWTEILQFKNVFVTGTDLGRSDLLMGPTPQSAISHSSGTRGTDCKS